MVYASQDDVQALKKEVASLDKRLSKEVAELKAGQAEIAAGQAEIAADQKKILKLFEEKQTTGLSQTITRFVQLGSYRRNLQVCARSSGLCVAHCAAPAMFRPKQIPTSRVCLVDAC